METIILVAVVIFGVVNFAFLCLIARGQRLLLRDVCDRNAVRSHYFIGQRVIVRGEIGTVVEREHENLSSAYVWVFLPSRKYASAYDPANVRPLPNGQV